MAVKAKDIEITHKRGFVDNLVLLIGLLALLYLLNIGAGVVEFLPDNMPVIGNLDEALSTLILTACARRWAGVQ